MVCGPNSWIPNPEPHITVLTTCRRLKDYNTGLSSESLLRVWKDILRIRDLIEIHWGIREKAKFLDVMRDLTATVEAGFAVLEKKTAFGVDIRRSSGCEIVLKKEWEC